MPEPADSDLTPTVAAGVRLTVIQQGFEQVARLGFTIAVARFVAPGDFGLMSMALVVTQLAILVSDLGVGVALVQRRELRPEHVATGFTVSSAFGVGLALLALLLAWPMASFFDEPRLAPVLAVVSATFVCKGVQGVPRDLLRRDFRFVPYTVTAAVALVAGIGVGFVAAVMGAGVWALVAYTMVESIVGMSLSLAMAWRAGVWSPALGIDRAALRDIAGFAGYMVGVRALLYAQNTSDNVVVGRVLGASALGFYGVAYRTMLIPVQKVADVVTSVAVPALAVMQRDVNRLRAAYVRSQQAAAVVSFPLAFGAAASSSLAIPVLLGARWAPAVGAVQVLALNGPRLVVGRLISALFQATGRPSWDFWVLLAGVPVSIAAFVAGARHGIVGVAVGLTVAGHLVFAAQLLLAARALQTSIAGLMAGLRGVLTASAAMVAAVVAVQLLVSGAAPDGLALAVAACCGAIAYVGTLVLVDPQVLGAVARDVFGRRTGSAPVEAVSVA